MSTPRLVSYVLGFLAFAGICAVCAIGGLKSSALAAPEPRLFYVSDPNLSEVAVFSLPDLVLKGTLIGFTKPHGLCSDHSGNIWVTSTQTRQILEYAHGGVAPIATLTDPYGYPFSCSVDTIAVGNIRNMSGPGETLVYTSGTPPSYDLAALNNVNGVAYDPGDLYIDGRTKTGTFVLAELPAGSTVIHQITITGGVIHYPGMVQWYKDGNYLAVGDRRCDTPRTTCIYHVKISGSTGTIIGKTKFKAYNGHVICDMALGAIGAHGEKFLAGGDDESACGYAASSVDRWAYPAGGLPTNNNHSTAFSHPFGTAISR
jgi:hypothetical protein